MAVDLRPKSDSFSSRYPNLQEATSSTFDLPLYPKQATVMQARTPFIGMVGATGTGKTWLGPIWVLEQIRKRGGGQKADAIVVGRNYHHHVAELLIPYFEEWFTAIGELHKVNRSRFTIYLPRFRSTIRFATDVAPDVMEGFHTGGCIWVDEAGLMKRKTWEIVRRRAKLLKAQILVTTIPYQAGWVKTDLFEPFRVGDKDVTYVHLTWRDNPAFDREAIEAERKRMPAHLFESVYEGNWARPYGMIFPEPDDVELLVDEWPVPDDWPMRTVAPGLEVPQGWPLFSGHDYGFTAPTAGVWGVLSPDDVLYIVACFEKGGQPIEEHVESWKELGLHKTDWSWGDPANPGEWMTATNHGMTITTDPGKTLYLNDVVYGIGVMTDRLQTGRLKIIQGAHAALWLKRREDYLWAPDPKTLGETLLEKPAAGEAEHLMDASRYLCVGLQGYASSPEMPYVSTGKATITSRGISRAIR